MIIIDASLTNSLGSTFDNPNKFNFDTLENLCVKVETYPEKYELVMLEVSKIVERKNKQTIAFVDRILAACTVNQKQVILFQVVGNKGEKNNLNNQVSKKEFAEDLDISLQIIEYKKAVLGKTAPLDLSALIEVIDEIQISSDISEMKKEVSIADVPDDFYSAVSSSNKEVVEEDTAINNQAGAASEGPSGVNAIPKGRTFFEEPQAEEDNDSSYDRSVPVNPRTDLKKEVSAADEVPITVEAFGDIKRKFLNGETSKSLQSIVDMLDKQSTVNELLSVLNENSSYMTLNRNLGAIRTKLLESQVNQKGSLVENFSTTRSLVIESMESLSERDKFMAVSFISLLNTIMDAVARAVVAEEEQIATFKVKTLDLSDMSNYTGTLVQGIIKENTRLMEQLTDNKTKVANIYDKLLTINLKIGDILKTSLDDSKNDYYIGEQKGANTADYIVPGYAKIFEMINDNKSQLIIQRNASDEIANESISILSQIITNQQQLISMLLTNVKVKSSFSISSLTGKTMAGDSAMMSLYTGSRGSGLTTSAYVCSTVQEHLYATLHVDLSPSTFEVLKSMHKGLIIPLGDALVNDELVKPSLGSQAPVVIAGSMSYDTATLNKLLSMLHVASVRFRKINIVIPGGKASKKVEEILESMLAVINIVTVFKQDSEKFTEDLIKEYEGKRIVKRVIYSNFMASDIPLELLEKYDNLVENKTLLRVSYVPSLPYIADNYIRRLPITDEVFNDVRLRSVLHENLC